MIVLSGKVYEIVDEIENFNAPSLQRILRGLGVLLSGIIEINNTCPSWDHERVKQNLLDNF
jgi:hypothetical protein